MSGSQKLTKFVQMNDICIDLTGLLFEDVAEAKKAVTSHHSYGHRKYNKLSYIIVDGIQRRMILLDGGLRDVNTNEETFLGIRLAVAPKVN